MTEPSGLRGASAWRAALEGPWVRASRRPLTRRAPLRASRRSFRTIVLFSLLYVCGMGLLTWCAGLAPPAEGDDARARQQASLLFLGLYAVALGTGGIKPNVSAFGADQFDTSNPRHVAQKASCAFRALVAAPPARIAR